MMLGVLRHWMTQGAQVVFVGDPYQEIYAWRGAISAMTRLDDIPTARLTQSFRYGPHIAQVANAILTYQRDVPSCIRGYHTIRDCVLESSPSQSNAMSQDQVTGELTHRPEGDPADAPHMEEEVTWDALLCRTNARVIEELMRHIHTRKCGVAGGVRQLLALIHDVASLQRGERATRSQELRDFESWEQLEEHARSEVGEDLMGLVRLVQSHDIHELIDLLEEVERTPDCEVELMISTAHKSKGLEWPRVKLASDFPAPRENGQKNPRWSHEEAHLLYVASTRACKVLDIRGCLAATQAMEALREDPSRIEEDLAPYDEVDEPDVPLPDGELATWLGKPSTSSTSSPVSSRTSEMFRPLGAPHSLLQTTQPKLASGYLTHGTFLKSEAFARLETLASAQGLDLESMLEELLDAHEESMALRMGKRWTQTSLF